MISFIITNDFSDGIADGSTNEIYSVGNLVGKNGTSSFFFALF
jgi:hypothetical protein